MRPEEQAFRNHVVNNPEKYMEMALWKPLLALPFGQWSQDFCQDENVAQFIREHGHSYRPTLLFRYLIEKHLTCNTPIEELNQFLKEYKDGVAEQKLKGEYLQKVDGALITFVYESKNEALIAWIKPYFPVPPQYCTAEQREEIINCSKEQMRTDLRATLIANNKNTLAATHLDKKAYREWRDSQWSSDNSKDASLNFTQWAQEFMDDSNTLYQPECDEATAKRIVDCAKKIAVLKTAKCPVISGRLVSIFDDALYSQSALADLYQPYNQFAKNTNAITLHLQTVTSREWNEDLTLEFNLAALLDRQPIAYCTQTDVLYRGVGSEFRTLRLGSNEKISFRVIEDHSSTNHFLLCLKSGNNEVGFAIPKACFISENVQELPAILTLNFFRFIVGTKADKYAASFYEKLAALSDAELETFLTDVQTLFADRAQLHLYRTHKIDFDTLQTIRHEGRHYKVSVPKLIEELNAGCIDTLRVAHSMIPELLQSQRFISYLVSKVTHEGALSYLQNSNKLTEIDDNYDLIKKQLRHGTSRLINKIEAAEYPVLECMRLLHPDADEWKNYSGEHKAWKGTFATRTLSVPEEVLTAVFEEARCLTHKKLLEYVESNVRQCMEKSVTYYDDFKDNRLYLLLPYDSDGKKDRNAKKRAILEKLFAECTRRILEEEKLKTLTPPKPQKVHSEKIPIPSPESQALSASGFDSTLQHMENTLKVESTLKTEHEQQPIAEEGKKLHQHLSHAREEFLRTGNLETLVHDVKQHVKKSEPVLKKSPVWKQFLLDILNALIFIGTLGISYAVTGHLRLFKAKQPKESEIEEMKQMKRSLQ